jgi:hypothetical protein
VTKGREPISNFNVAPGSGVTSENVRVVVFVRWVKLLGINRTEVAEDHVREINEVIPRYAGRGMMGYADA